MPAGADCRSRSQPHFRFVEHETLVSENLCKSTAFCCRYENSCTILSSFAHDWPEKTPTNSREGEILTIREVAGFFLTKVTGADDLSARCGQEDSRVQGWRDVAVLGVSTSTAGSMSSRPARRSASRERRRIRGSGSNAGPTLREEFRGKRLKGTAIELSNHENTGAT